MSTLTPHSKEEAVRLANAEAGCLLFTKKDVDRSSTLRAFARYIKANPVISAEDRKEARELADQYFILEGEHNQTVARLLRLIAGPEEVDPLKAEIDRLIALDQTTREIIRQALHRGAELSDIIKQGE